MIPMHVPRGWYCDARPSGAYVVLIRDSHLITDRGRVELPHGQNLLYVALAPDGIRFAGQGHRDDLAWEWTGSQWVSHGHAPGVRPCIYDAAGVLRIARAGGPTGSQGWRCVAPDGSLVTADATYADPQRRIWEYTDLSGVTIGQSGDGPHGPDAVLALSPGGRYVIAEGQCRFIRAHQDAHLLAIAWVNEHDSSASLLWLGLDEVATFPRQRVEQPAPSPDPEPTPEPEEPVSVPNLLEIVKAERAKYGPVPSDAELGRMLNAIAWKGNGNRADGPWGLSVKPSGTNCPAPDGTLIAHDILHHKPTDTLWDVLEAAGAQATPTWGQVEHHRNPQRPWKAPLPPMGGDQDDPGDSDERPGPGPAMDPRLLPIAQELTVVAVRLDESIAALRGIKPAPTPEPHECPTPRWPDDHECPAPGPVTTLTEPDAQAARRGWERIWRGPLPGDLLTFLLYRLLVEGAAVEDLDAEVGRRRGQ